MRSKEAIELLEKAKEHLERFFGGSSSNCYEYLTQALDILKQQPAGEPKCKTCGDYKEILMTCRECKAEKGRYCKIPNCPIISCPDCSQPAAGMTKKFNEIIEEAKSMFAVSQAIALNNFNSTTFPIEGETRNPDPPPREFTKEKIETRIFESQNWVNARDWNKLQARLDRAEFIKAELLGACEDVKRYNEAAKEGKINPEEGGDYWEVVIDTVEVAISKAEKEG